MADNFVAEIRVFPFNFAPVGWATCDGQLLPISQNTALFSLLGTTYGGNGTSTFGLPNFQGTAPMFYGQGAGLSDHVEGEIGGATTITLITPQMPAHAHDLRAFVGRGASATDLPAGNLLTTSEGGAVYNPAVPAVPAVMNANALGNAGGSEPHNNLMPFLTFTFCIALQGIYPSQS